MLKRPISIAVALLLVSGSAPAQDIKWRHDYAAARKEAAETGKPLLFDFGTESCTWCRKLDATTFRDPKVVKLLNENFIPVKVDANKFERLTASMGIDGFPTLIVAASDGKVIGRHAGYADAKEIAALTDKATAKPTAAIERNGSDSEWLRAKAKVDADLRALYPKIAADLNR
jgi:thioredoxin-related protein